MLGIYISILFYRHKTSTESNPVNIPSQT